jgi:hypothetical protein
MELERKQRQGLKMYNHPREYCAMCDLHFYGNLISHRKNVRHQVIIFSLEIHDSLVVIKCTVIDHVTIACMQLNICLSQNNLINPIWWIQDGGQMF